MKEKLKIIKFKNVPLITAYNSTSSFLAQNSVILNHFTPSKMVMLLDGSYLQGVKEKNLRIVRKM